MIDLYASAEKLQKRLTKNQIPSAIIGGIAVACWSEPRFTQDVDLKVMIERDDAKKLLEALNPDFQAIQEEPERAIRRFGYIFMKDRNDIRYDLLLTDTSFDREVIAHAQEVQIVPRIKLRVCSAEALIVYKMISTRARDANDVQNVIARQQDKLDDAYVIRWLKEFEQALDDSTLVTTYQSYRRHK